MLTHDTSGLNQKRLKMVIPLKVVPLGDGGLNDVPPSFGSYISKSWYFGNTKRLSRV